MVGYTSLFLVYLLFLAMLTFMVISTADNRLVPHLYNISYENVKLYSYNASQTAGFLELLDVINAPVQPQLKSAYIGCMIVVLCIMALIIFKEAMELFSKGWRYFLDVTNYLELATCGCCITYIGSFLHEIIYDEFNRLTYQMGAITIFLAWFNLLRYCQP
jgi:hypothetical protein